MGTIYVSSTKIDLENERAAARAAILRLGHTPKGMEDYGADELTVLEKCASDVEDCDAYLLIVGWRYGWRPPGQGGKSITELEWEAAKGSHRMPFIYLSEERTKPEKAPFGDEDLQGVLAFRARLAEPSEPMTGRFDAPAKLTFDLLADIGLRMKSPIDFPSDLRVSCARQDHVASIAGAWNAPPAPGRAARGPIVALFFGEREQGHHFLAQRVAGSEMKRLPRRGVSAPALPEPVVLDWSVETTPEKFVPAMHQALFARLSGDARAIWSFEDLVAQKQPLVVGVEVPTDSWKKPKAKLLEEYAASWFRPPLDAIDVPTIVLVYARSMQPAVKKTLEEIAARLASKGRIRCLPELHDVKESHAMTWAQSPGVRAFCRDRDATESVKTIFRRKADWEMEPLMTKLEDVASRIAGR